MNSYFRPGYGPGVFVGLYFCSHCGHLFAALYQVGANIKSSELVRYKHLFEKPGTHSCLSCAQKLGLVPGLEEDNGP